MIIFDDKAKELLRQVDEYLHDLDNEINHPKISAAHDVLHNLASRLADNQRDAEEADDDARRASAWLTRASGTPCP